MADNQVQAEQSNTQAHIEAPGVAKPVEPADPWYKKLIDKARYFPLLRMGMYLWEADYSYVHHRLSDMGFIRKAAERFEAWTHKIVGPIGKSSHEMIDGVRHTHTMLENNWKKKLLSVTPFTRDINGMRPRTEPSPGHPNGEAIPYFHQKLPGRTSNPQVRTQLFARNLVNLLEAVTFATITTISLFSDRKDMVRDFAKAASEELGKKSEEITFSDLKKCKNPFIKNEMSKHGWTYFIRYFTDSAFAWGLRTGIILKTLSYPAEYIAFLTSDTVPALRKSVKDAQQNQLGDLGQNSIVIGMIRAAQEIVRKNKLSPIGTEEMEKFKAEIFRPLAKRMVSGESKVGDFYVVCKDMLDPGRRFGMARGNLMRLNGIQTVENQTAAGSVQEEVSDLWRRRMAQQAMAATPALP